jgi:peptide deformylase
MALRKLVYFPDPVLLTKAAPVTVFDSAFQTLIDDMIETMYHERGIGLAAPQIGVNQQVAVIDISKNKDQVYCLINPEITSKEKIIKTKEGCLSVPGAYEATHRAYRVHLKALDRYGKPYELDAEDLLAHVIQHETDHLHGVLYIDLISTLRRQRAIHKMNTVLKKHRL